MLRAEKVSYSFPARAAPALVDCSLIVRRGDPVLLEGASGGGKSTLLALLARLRSPRSGAVLAEGLDLSARGAAG